MSLGGQAAYILATNDAVQPNCQHPSNQCHTALQCHWLLGRWQQSYSITACFAIAIGVEGGRNKNGFMGRQIWESMQSVHAINYS